MSPIAFFKALFRQFYCQLRKVGRAIVLHPRRAITAFLLVLWTCRVSVIALVGPALVLAVAPQGRDLFSYFAGHMVVSTGAGNWFLGEISTIAYWALMCGLTMYFWSYPVHSSARVLMYFPDWLFAAQRNPRNSEIRRVRLLYRPLIIWIPRLLAAAPFVILAVAARRARQDVPGPVLVATVTEDMNGQFTHLLYFLEIAFYLCAAGALYFFAQVRGPAMLRRAPDATPFAPRGAPLRHRYRAALGGEEDIKSDYRYSRRWLAVITVALLAVLFGPPHLTKILYLALIVPFVAGSWVPFFTWLVWYGQRFRLPVAAGFFVFLAVLTFFWGDNHDISRAAQGIGPRVTVAEAIDRWKTVNCHGGCPQPIIVSTAGGASRAAFFTLTVLGALMDDASIAPPNPADPHAAARRVINRVFAISSVSGGSAGAVIYAAAVANSPDGAQPCNARESSFWFKAGPPTGWRDCLQAISAEDFLSETIAGLAFRDNLNFLARVIDWPDRAVVLEQSFAQAFENWVRKPDGANFHGLDSPFLSFGAKPSGEWRPLLAINGTSVTTGRRILTSHFAPAGPQPVPAGGVGGKQERLFMDAYDLHELLAQIEPAAPVHCDSENRGACDVQLATAATNSARFPIISPPGVLRRGGDGGEVADRIVDGGYFENDGVTTTIDLVRALQHAGLHPAVIHIANDPLPYPRQQSSYGANPTVAQEAVAPVAVQGPAAPKAEDRSWLLFLRGPLGSLFATRSARASYALSDLEQQLGDAKNFTEILVFGEPKQNLSLGEAPPPKDKCIDVQPPKPGASLKEVSMSWWLSQPAQAYLDAQLRIGLNCQAVEKIRGWLRDEAFASVVGGR
jgi:hypothetical protein